MVIPFAINVGLAVEVGKACVWLNGQEIPLSAAELAILVRLYRARGHLVSTVQLENAIYEQPGCEEMMGEIKYHICTLRRKMNDHDHRLIYCRRRLGYGLNAGAITWLE